MRYDFAPLDAALRACRDAALPLPLWWRDDDAVEPTAALDRLAGLSETLALPVHLAVIPKHADEALRNVVNADTNLIPMVHGWAHMDHSSTDQKKSEFGEQRADAATDAAKGLARLTSLFGARLVPVFVPPWNRIAPELLPQLGAMGYAGLSTFGPRPMQRTALPRINTHIDPINWRGDRSLVPLDQIIAQTASLIWDRLKQRADATEPMGLLTHHLVHDAAIWDFSAALLGCLLDGGAVPINLHTHKDNLP